MTTEVTKQAETGLQAILTRGLPQLKKLAPKYLTAERIMRLTLTAAISNPAILCCTEASVIKACMDCAKSGLEPIGAGGMWLIPYGDTLTAIPDYRGMTNAAKRAGCLSDGWAEAGYENDQFDYGLGMNPHLDHKPALKDRGALIAAYYIMVMPSGDRRFVMMDAEEINAIRSRSKAGRSGPWVTDPGEMAKKTVVRRAMKQFSGASKELDATLEVDDSALGIDFTPKAEKPPAPVPQEKKAEGVTVTEAPGHTQDDAPADDEQEPGFGAGLPVVRGLVEACVKKELSTKSIVWRIAVAGEEYSTFKREDAAVADACMAGNKEVEIEYTTKPKGGRTYRDIVTIKAV